MATKPIAAPAAMVVQRGRRCGAKRHPIIAIVIVTALFGLTSGSSNVTNQTALYREAPPETVGTAAGLLRTFGYVGSIAASTITGIAFRTHVDDGALHHVSLILIGIGVVVMLMTILDRDLARADDLGPRENGNERRTMRRFRVLARERS